MSALKYLFAFSLVFLFSAVKVNAQQEHFLYLQTENQKPFYAKLDNKVLSSTSSGYLILPKLEEGRYLVTIGFPRNEFPEEKFSLEIKDKNEGYLLKQLNDDNFSLFNLQTLAVVEPVRGGEEQVKTVETTKDDPFTTMLAKATKDPTLLKSEEKVTVPVTPKVESPVIQVAPPEEKEEVALEKKEEESSRLASNEGKSVITLRSGDEKGKNIEEAESKDIVSAEKHSLISGLEATSEDLEDSGTNLQEKEMAETKGSSGYKSQVKRILFVKGKAGRQMIYVDDTGGKMDTIRIFLPKEMEMAAKNVTDNEKMPKAQMEDNEDKEELPYTITPTVVMPKEEPRKQSVITFEDKTEKKEGEIIVMESAENDKRKDVEGELIILPPASSDKINTNCASVAGDRDFLRIRKRMAAERSNEGMVEAAKRIFQNTCFSTEQIRNLSYLFLNDEGRYMFFDAAYKHTSDPERFPSLESQLKDEYYINRFKAMIQK